MRLNHQPRWFSQGSIFAVTTYPSTMPRPEETAMPPAVAATQKPGLGISLQEACLASFQHPEASDWGTIRICISMHIYIYIYV